MKKLQIEFFGLEKFADAQTSEGEGLDARSAMSVYEDAPYELTFIIDGKEYRKDDFGKEEDLLTPEQSKEFKGLSLNEFFEQIEGCEIGMLYTNKASGEFFIELEDNEEFDPLKACLIIRDFTYKTMTAIDVLQGFAYQGRVYECYVTWTVGKYGETIWKAPAEDRVVMVNQPTEEMKTLLEGSNLQELPFLFFRTTKIGSNYEAEDNEISIDCEDWMNEEGLMVVVSPYEKADGFVSRGTIWDILTNIVEEKRENDFNWYEIDVYVTEGLALLNCENSEISERNALDTIEAVWSKSRPFSSSTPEIDPLLIRHIIHTRPKKRFQTDDYILCKGKLCRLPVRALDTYFDRETEMSLFAFDEDPDVLRKNTHIIQNYRRLSTLDAGEEVL